MAKKRKSEATGLDEVDKTMYTAFCSAANSLSQLYTQAQNQQKLAFSAGERHGMVWFLIGSALLMHNIEKKVDWFSSLRHSTKIFKREEQEEKLYQLILRQNEEGSRVTSADIVAYLENELDCAGEETSATPGSQAYQQNPQPQSFYSNSGTLSYSGATGHALAHGTRLTHSDLHKNSIFSNALSSPVRRGLLPFHLAQAGYFSNNALQSGNGCQRAGSLDADQPGASNDLHGSLQHHDISSVIQSIQVCKPHPHQNRASHSFTPNDSSMDIHED